MSHMQPQDCADGCCVSTVVDTCNPPTPPTCSLTGVRSGDDITLNWDTSTINNALAELRDKFGRIISTATGVGNSLFIQYGICNGPWTLLVYNDCQTLPVSCTFSLTLNASCDCKLCPGEVSTLPTTRPSEVCVPCECSRGRGTAVSLTISGVQDFSLGPYLAQVWHQNANGGFQYPIGCRITIPSGGVCPNVPDIAFDNLNTSRYNGFAALNGTYVFALGSNQCENCGQAFICSVAPDFYKITATVTTHFDNWTSNDLPLCYNSGNGSTARTIVDAVNTIEIAVGFLQNGQLKINPSSFVDCGLAQGLSGNGPRIFYRYTNRSFSVNGGPIINSSTPNAVWRLFSDTRMTFGTAADTCGYRKTGASVVPVFNPTCFTPSADVRYPGFKEGQFTISDFEEWFLSYGTSIESAFTTIGWP